MLNAFRCQWARAILCILLALAQPQFCSSTQAAPGLSAHELARLRPVVMPDLRRLLVRVYNDNPSAVDLEKEFQDCHFTQLKLGTLGPAVLVEAEAGHGKSNAAMLNIYVPSHGSYRRILEAAGFGPEVFRGPGPVPDLAFGWSSGVCYTKYYRYRYVRGKYTANACYQEDRGENWDGGDCTVKSCEGNLPIFSLPSDHSSDPAAAIPEESHKSAQPSPGK